MIPPTPTGGVVLDFGDLLTVTAFISYGYDEGTQAGFGYGFRRSKEIDDDDVGGRPLTRWDVNLSTLGI